MKTRSNITYRQNRQDLNDKNDNKEDEIISYHNASNVGDNSGNNNDES